MKNTILILLLVLTTCSTFAQFSSVKDGDWRTASTWSTDPNATAIPDSNSTVFVRHYVVASSTGYYPAECYDLTIKVGGVIDAYTSAAVGGSLTIKNDLINNGTISPAYDFWLEVGGNLYNNGIITKHYISQYQRLYIMGDIYNNGSFHFTHTYFSKMDLAPNANPHLHYIKSQNDSTIFLGETMFMDSLGTMVIDSFAILNGTINLNKSKMILPTEVAYPNTLVLDNATIYGGIIEANRNTISTNGTLAYLGYIYAQQTPNLIFINANLVGRFLSGGYEKDYYGNSLVIFQGETTFEGNFADWYSGSIWYNGDRGIFIDGTFTNNGTIYDATSDKGLFLNQKNNSTFISNGTLNNKAIIFSGTCNFSVSDSLSATQFKATDSNTVVNITQGDLIFKDRTVTVDFNGGILNLKSGSKFYTTYQWYNQLKNIFVEANNSEIAFAHVAENTVISHPKISYIEFSDNSTLLGDVKIIENGTLIAWSNSYPRVSIEGNIENYGTIRNHYSSGSLYLTITGNIHHDGRSWENLETKLNGTNNQNIIIPNDSSWTGKVVLDAMLTGTTYQWQKGGSDISQATQSTLTFNNGLSVQEYGLYQCIVDGNPSRKIYIGASSPAAFEIYDVVITNLNSTQTKIEWKTTVPATGFVFYAENDASSGYPFEAMEESGLVLEHSLTLDTLHYGSTYYFIIDQNDEGWANNIRSEEFSFVAGDSLVGINDVNEIPKEFSLSQNYPNPFNPSTTIKFSIPQAGEVSLKIFDILGNEVAEIVNEFKQQGTHKILFNSSNKNLSSGIYYYKIKSKENILTKKMIFLK